MKRQLKNIFLLLFILTFSLRLTAQDKTIDSLKLALKNAKHDTTRCNILNAMVEAEGDDAVWQIYNEQLLKLAEKGAANAATITHKRFYLKHLADALRNIGYIYENQGDIAKALNYYQKSLKINKEIKNKKGIANTSYYIGSLYFYQGLIPNALDYNYKCLKILEEIKDTNGIAASLNNIGFIYAGQNDILKAFDFYQNSLRFYEKIEYKLGIASALINIGTIKERQGDLSKALDYYQRSLKINKAIKNNEGIAYSLNNIAVIYYKQGDIRNSLKYNLNSLKIREEIEDKLGIAYSLNNIGAAMLKMGRVGGALGFAKRSLIVAKELGYPENIKNAANTLKSIYKKQNNFKEALVMYELEIQMRDSMNNAETKKASIKKQFQYEYEKKAAADSVKNAEEQKVKNALLTAQQAQLKQEKTQRLALYGGLVLVIAFLGFVFNRFKVTQKQKVIIEQQKVLVDEAFKHLEEKNKEVMDSIHYAKRIQTALMSNEKYIDKQLNRLSSNKKT